MSRLGRIARIYVSFRQEDSGPESHRLCERLSAYFGKDRLCLENIQPNPDDLAQQALNSCALLLAIVGKHWITDANGRRYFDDPADAVCRDLVTCFDQAIPVLLALVNGAAMPAPADLPEALSALAACNMIALRDEHFLYDVDRLITKLDVLLLSGQEDDQPEEFFVNRIFGKYRRTDVRYLHADILWLDTTLGITDRRLLFHSHFLTGATLRFLHTEPRQAPVEIWLGDIAEIDVIRERFDALRIVTNSGMDHLFIPFSGEADAGSGICHQLAGTIRELVKNTGS